MPRADLPERTTAWRRRGLLLLGLAAYCAVACLLMRLFDVPCVFREFLGIPCPGCGMTRALLCLLRLDFVGAAQNNAVIFFMPYVFLYILLDWKHRAHKLILAGIAGIAIIQWIIKLILYF